MSLNRLTFSAAIATVVVAASCDDPLALQPAFDASFVDTVTIYALRGTDIALPSGYDVVLRTPARTDRQQGFDFSFDIDGDGVSRVFPRGALGLGQQSGIVFSDDEFDEIRVAPTEGYELDSALVVGVDSLFVVRSRPDNFGCQIFIGSLPRYGKFEVLEIDMGERSITFKTLVNINCGYRGLEPGIPER